MSYLVKEVDDMSFRCCVNTRYKTESPEFHCHTIFTETQILDTLQFLNAWIGIFDLGQSLGGPSSIEMDHGIKIKGLLTVLATRSFRPTTVAQGHVVNF